MIRALFIIFFITVIYGCASKLTPGGGPKDVTPPLLLSVDPPAKSLLFHSRQVTFNFNEYIQVTDLQNQLVISPIVDPAPSVKAYKKILTLTFPDSLRPNTTYTVNFGKAVVDVHESNPVEGLRYVFSTGSQLDSLHISGKVKDGASGRPLKNITVMLYRISQVADSIVFKKKPDYFARTSDDGSYLVSNLATGNYVIAALDDKNGDYLFSDPSESIGYADSVINLAKDTVPADLRLSLPRPSKQSIKQVSRPDKVTVLVQFTRPADSLQVLNLDAFRDSTVLTWMNSRKDSLLLFSPDSTLDSMKLLISGSNRLNDTLLLQMQAKNAKDKNAFRISTDIVEYPQDSTSALIFQVNHPFTFNEQKFELVQDSIFHPPFHIYYDSSSNRNFMLGASWKYGSAYKLRILPGGITDHYGLINDTLRYEFRVADERELGELTVRVNGNVSPYSLLQLCDNDFHVFSQRKINQAGAYKFSRIRPGNYIMRLVDDRNSNGRWDEGSFAARIQPEGILTGEELQVRANWELETVIIVP